MKFAQDICPCLAGWGGERRRQSWDVATAEGVSVPSAEHQHESFTLNATDPELLAPEERFDCHDNELESLNPSELSELNDAMDDTLIESLHIANDDELHLGGTSARRPTEATIAELNHDLSDLLPGLGLDDGGAPADGVAGESQPSPPTDVPVPSATEEFFQSCSSRSDLGYIYRNGRSILRIQRSKPRRGSVTITCYLHVACQLLVSESRCGDDRNIVQWYFEGEAPSATATSKEAKELKQKHLDLGRQRWWAK